MHAETNLNLSLQFAKNKAATKFQASHKVRCDCLSSKHVAFDRISKHF